MQDHSDLVTVQKVMKPMMNDVCYTSRAWVEQGAAILPPFLPRPWHVRCVKAQRCTPRGTIFLIWSPLCGSGPGPCQTFSLPNKNLCLD